MGGRTFPLEPRAVEPVHTAFRRIQTKLPVPESIPILERLREAEPVSMSGQPPVIWDTAEGCLVRDRWGNQWLDWSSGVLVTNAGHGRREVAEAIIRQAQSPLLHNYCFPNEARAELASLIVSLAPKELSKCFLLTTGAETTECAIKLAKTWGCKVGGPGKQVIVTFDNDFHGRTLGAQLAGGIPALKSWIGGEHKDFVQVPFPGEWRLPPEQKTFAAFEKALAGRGVKPDQVAGVMYETYQGGSACFMPVEVAKQMRAWCDRHQIVMIADEVQAAFGRCGTLFGFEHYGIVPDLVCCGKGISSSLPLSCVIGKAEIMNLYGPGEMTSTHTGNPVCAAAAIANVKLILRENLIENAAHRGESLLAGLNRIREKHVERVGPVQGKGLVAAFHMVHRGTIEPDPDAAFAVVVNAMERGLLMFSPVGLKGGTVKISPPLVVTEEQIQDGLRAFEESVDRALAG